MFKKMIKLCRLVLTIILTISMVTQIAQSCATKGPWEPGIPRRSDGELCPAYMIQGANNTFIKGVRISVYCLEGNQ